MGLTINFVHYVSLFLYTFLNKALRRIDDMHIRMLSFCLTTSLRI